MRKVELVLNSPKSNCLLEIRKKYLLCFSNNSIGPRKKNIFLFYFSIMYRVFLIEFILHYMLIKHKLPDITFYSCTVFLSLQLPLEPSAPFRTFSSLQNLQIPLAPFRTFRSLQILLEPLDPFTSFRLSSLPLPLVKF